MADDVNQSPNGPQPATQRADVLLDQAGQRLGEFAALARIRLRALATQGAQAAQEAVARSSQAFASATADHDRAATGAATGATTGATTGAATSGDSETGTAPGSAPAPQERAEVLVDAAGARLTQFGQTASQRMQILLAYLREEGEDIWAEAQSMRRHDHTTTSDEL